MPSNSIAVCCHSVSESDLFLWVVTFCTLVAPVTRYLLGEFFISLKLVPFSVSESIPLIENTFSELKSVYVVSFRSSASLLAELSLYTHPPFEFIQYFANDEHSRRRRIGGKWSSAFLCQRWRTQTVPEIDTQPMTTREKKYIPENQRQNWF